LFVCAQAKYYMVNIYRGGMYVLAVLAGEVRAWDSCVATGVRQQGAMGARDETRRLAISLQS